MRQIRHYCQECQQWTVDPQWHRDHEHGVLEIEELELFSGDL